MSNDHLGDAVYEHLRMKRGPYRANTYVILATLVQVYLMVLGGMSLLRKLVDPQSIGEAAWLTLTALSVAFTVAVYWNRRSVVEAFASRFTFGSHKLSVFTAIPAAMIYANVRFIAFLFRVEARVGAWTEAEGGVRPAPHLRVRNAAR